MSNQVKPLYMEQNDLLIHKATVTKFGTSEINKKPYKWVQLNETIFHPKGGGQLNDDGTIDGIPVSYVHKEIPYKTRLDQFEIYHCFEEVENINFKEGQQVELKVDPSKRKLNSRLHTAGHVLAEAVNALYPSLQAYQGNHYPNDCFVRFKINDPSIELNIDEIKQKAGIEAQKIINQDLPVSNLMQSGMRSIKITQEWSPCGGTHLASLKEIGKMEITDVSLNKKEGTVRIKYTLI